MIKIEVPLALLERPIPSGISSAEWPTAQAPLPEPRTRQSIAAVNDELRSASAVVVSLPPQWSDHELTCGTWNLICLLMQPCEQYETGELVYPIEVRSDASVSSHYSTSAESGGLHTDGSLLSSPPDFGVLLCLSSADEGGETVLVPVDSILEHLDKAQVARSSLLEKDFAFAVDDDPERDVRVWAPILREGAKGMEFRYLRRYIETGASRTEPLTSTMKATLDAIDDYVLDPANQTPFRLGRGELLIWENARFLHGRRAFRELNCRRRLVRIYGRSDLSRPLATSSELAEI